MVIASLLRRPLAKHNSTALAICRRYQSTTSGGGSSKKRAVALSVHFCHPQLGMKSHEILSRSTAFLVAVDPPEIDWIYPTQQDEKSVEDGGAEQKSATTALLEKSERDRQVKKLQQHYSRTPAGGPPRHPKDLGWLEFCPVQHRPAVHVISSSHVISPWQWPNYYQQDWLKQVQLEHCSYTLDVYDMDTSNGSNATPKSLAKLPLNPYPIHHPAEMDVAIMHLQGEDSALKTLQSFGVEPLYLRSDDKAFERDQTVYFDGFEVAEEAADNMAAMESAPGESGSQSTKSDDDNRVFIPFKETGSLFYASPERFLAKTDRPLPEGLCGGPALDTEGNVAGIVEGIVPLNHEDERLAGAAAFLPSPVLREFITWAERAMLQKIVPEQLFTKIVDLKDGKALNEEGTTIPSPTSMLGDAERGGIGTMSKEGENLELAYEEMMASLSKTHTPEQVAAIKATVEREQQEVMDIMATEGGDLDEVIARVRARTRQKQEEIMKEAAETIQDAEIISETTDSDQEKKA
jgi:hypothetical protein